LRQKGGSWRLPPRERVPLAARSPAAARRVAHARRAPRAAAAVGPLPTPPERRGQQAAGPARGSG